MLVNRNSFPGQNCDIFKFPKVINCAFRLTPCFPLFYTFQYNLVSGLNPFLIYVFIHLFDLNLSWKPIK